MSCPYGHSDTDTDQSGDNNVQHGGVTYGEYLQLDKVLGAQTLLSANGSQAVDDEHLFIVTHQAYELWFKQLLYDLDRVRQLMAPKVMDESDTLQVVSLLGRMVRILQLLVDQMLILETMSPLDFLEFREFLAPASGFQSLQFRLLENKLGISDENRVKYNSQHYRNVFRNDTDKQQLLKSETEVSLFKLFEKWLERSPREGENFWVLYHSSVHNYLNDKKLAAQTKTTDAARQSANKEYEKLVATFDTILDPEKHKQAMTKGERRLSHKAMQGALMINFYKDLPRFSQPYMILTYLMDIDSLITKWRYNHVMLVQRQLGSKLGTGGSSGYLYLRSTISDRYKVFLDLFNLSTWLVPRAYVPKLSVTLRKRLTICPEGETSTDDEHP